MSDDLPEFNRRNLAKQLTALLGRKDAMIVLRRVHRRLRAIGRDAKMSYDQLMTLCDEEIELMVQGAKP
jgi:hypothetical protein